MKSKPLSYATVVKANKSEQKTQESGKCSCPRLEADRMSKRFVFVFRRSRPWIWTVAEPLPQLWV